MKSILYCRQGSSLTFSAIIEYMQYEIDEHTLNERLAGFKLLLRYRLDNQYNSSFILLHSHKSLAFLFKFSRNHKLISKSIQRNVHLSILGQFLTCNTCKEPP